MSGSIKLEAVEVLAPFSPGSYALDLCARIARCTETAGSITRLFLSPATHAVHAILRAEMEALGIAVRVDAAGNLRGIYPALAPGAPVLLTGSHIDTVPDGGAYDGVLGVAIPLAVLKSLGGRRLHVAVEVIAFSEEEGIRFRMPFIGSRAVVGSLGEPEFSRRDQDGITIRQALRDFGVEGAEPATPTPGTFAFIECHIEQGPVLEALDLPLGVVSGIVGQTRLEVAFTGQANHAGTTPMPLRRDALAATAAWIAAVERYAHAHAGLVATVGTIQVQPGAANVIAGSAIASLDVRHGSDAVRARAVADLMEEATREASLRGVTVAFRETSRQDATAMDSSLTDQLATAVAASGVAAHRMFSGAGHDAMILATKMPAAMLFLRTPGGLSHHPDEAVADADVADACAALEAFLEHLELPQ